MSATQTTAIQPETAASGSQPLWTPTEFAAVVKMHPETIRKCVRQGRIKALHFGRGLRIPASEAARILEGGFR